MHPLCHWGEHYMIAEEGWALYLNHRLPRKQKSQLACLPRLESCGKEEFRLRTMADCDKQTLSLVKIRGSHNEDGGSE